jgi:hypothetical protein
VIGVGGLWVAWTTTSQVVIQPLVLGGLYVAVGGLSGAVVGQAWRVDPRARHDRAWAAPAVVAHGILIAGFGYLASTALDPSIPSVPPAALALLIPAVLLGFAFRRWLRGRRVLAILLDVAILAMGLLGWVSWQSLASAGGGSTDPMSDIAIGITVAAAAVATATAFYRMPTPSSPTVTTDELPAPAPSTMG